jgi:hypothetical protein
MTKEEIIEEIAEGIFQYSNCQEEIELNTIEYLADICKEVRESVNAKVKSRTAVYSIKWQQVDGRREN